MCLDGRAAALLVAAASMVAGVADKPGQQPAATSPVADPSPPDVSTARRSGVGVTVRLELPRPRSAINLSGIVRDNGGRGIAGATVVVTTGAAGLPEEATVLDAVRMESLPYRARTSRRFGITTRGADGRYHRRGPRAGAALPPVPLAAAVIGPRLTPAR
jgi:hypothetical protein